MEYKKWGLSEAELERLMAKSEALGLTPKVNGIGFLRVFKVKADSGLIELLISDNKVKRPKIRKVR